MKILLSVIGLLFVGGICGGIILSLKLNIENIRKRKYDEEKDLRRRGIDPKTRKRMK